MKRIVGNPGFSLLPLVATLLVVIIDREFRGSNRLIVHAVADEVVHALTGFVFMLGLLRFFPPIRLLPGLIGSIAMDIDHAPEILGFLEPEGSSSRFITHSLATVACVSGISFFNTRRRMAWISAAIGIGIHLFRDAATGNIIAAWPLSDAPFSVPYTLYLVSLAGTSGFHLAIMRPSFSVKRYSIGSMRLGDRLHD